MMPTVDTPCVLWLGATHDGYPMFGKRRAHRIMYEAARGTLASGYVVHHRCENKLCVEPAHLAAMTASDHMLLHGTWEKSHAVSRARDTCIHGHPRDGVRKVQGRERRYCTTCHKADGKRRRDVKAAVRRLQPWLPQTPQFGMASEADGAVPETIDGEATDAG